MERASGDEEDPLLKVPGMIDQGLTDRRIRILSNLRHDGDLLVVISPYWPYVHSNEAGAVS